MTLSLLTSLPLSLLSPSVPTATTVRMAASTATTVCDVKTSVVSTGDKGTVVANTTVHVPYIHNGRKIVKIRMGYFSHTCSHPLNSIYKSLRTPDQEPSAMKPSSHIFLDSAYIGQQV